MFNRKEYNKKFSKEHYKVNKAAYIKRAIEYTKKVKLRNKQFLLDYLLKHPCIDCEECDPIVLEFDHKDSKNKIDCVVQLAEDGISIKKLKEEIEKCDVRCANCHRRKTAKQRNYYRHNRIN